MNTVAAATSVLFIIIVIATAAFICRRIVQDPVADPFFFFSSCTYEHEIITYVCIKIIVNYILVEYKYQ